MRRAGFTLVEIAVTTLVVLILLGISISLGPGASARESLDEAARQVVSDLRRAQEMAITRNTTVSLTIASAIAGEDGYRILEGSGGALVAEVPLPAGVTFDSREIGKSIRFDHLGGVSSTTDLRIAPAVPRPYILDLVGRDGATRTVQIMAGTGLARAP